MNYLSILYLFLFLPLTVIIYHIVKKKYKWRVLLLASYIFFFLISGNLLIYLLFTTLSIHHFGMWLEKIDGECGKVLNETVEDKKEIKEQFKRKKRKVLFLGILIQVGILFVYKYMPFFTVNINSIFNMLNIPYQFKIIKLLAPIGVSFYTLEALSYMIDVYNKKINADDNLGRLALYLAFFPQIMEGPIARYSETAESLYEGHKITFKNICFGSQRILWGILKKFIIADRLNVVVKAIFATGSNYDGGLVLLGAISYTLMLYMEFSGTIDVVIGSAEIFDVHLPENFRQPFFAKNISEFWMRWHITLGAWFKDYIFYPVSLSKKMKKFTIKARKILGNYFGPIMVGSVALFAVWSLNGLWHGAGWNYIFFGMYHFVLIVLGSFLEPGVRKLCHKLHINRDNLLYRFMQFSKLFILVVIGELFFRANTLKEGFRLFGNIINNFTLNSFFNNEFLKLGLDRADYVIIIITLIIIFVIGLLKEKGVNIRESIASKNIVIRWVIYFSLIMFIIIFGAYGPGYAPVDPIYANF